METRRVGSPNGKLFTAPHDSFAKRSLRRFHSCPPKRFQDTRRPSESEQLQANLLENLPFSSLFFPLSPLPLPLVEPLQTSTEFSPFCSVGTLQRWLGSDLCGSGGRIRKAGRGCVLPSGRGRLGDRGLAWRSYRATGLDVTSSFLCFFEARMKAYMSNGFTINNHQTRLKKIKKRKGGLLVTMSGRVS